MTGQETDLIEGSFFVIKDGMLLGSDRACSPMTRGFGTTALASSPIVKALSAEAEISHFLFRQTSPIGELDPRTLPGRRMFALRQHDDVLCV